MKIGYSVMNQRKNIFFFNQDETEGHDQGKKILGGKGANLIEMARIGIPVPPGIIISTQTCNHYLKHGELPEGFDEELELQLTRLGESLDRSFGGKDKPLLVSVRSGSPVSMPGMMDTILNLGLHAGNLQSIIEATKNQRFILDSYRRFIQMYSNVVLNIDSKLFEKQLTLLKKEKGFQFDHELKVENLLSLIDNYLELVEDKMQEKFPMNPQEQLKKAILAVFRSWNNERAVYYRKINHIPSDYGTAVSIQSMVFGNMSNDSATGVAFTRNPATGEKEFYGEYLINAQGEDVVAGIRTPKPIAQLANDMPEVYADLFKTQKLLEDHFKDMQDIEFTIQEKKLYILQTRNGKRTGIASLKIAVDMVDEMKITKNEALLKIDPQTIPSLLAPIFDPKEKQEILKKTPPLTVGLNAGPGCAAGIAVFNTPQAVELAEQGKSVILIREETNPEDIIAMQHAKGIVTARGGMTSHAAVVARGMNKPCIVGCHNLHIDSEKDLMKAKPSNGGEEVIIRKGDEISIDGNSGEVMQGFLNNTPSEIERYLDDQIKVTPLVENFLEILTWADEVRKLKVRANADTPIDSKIARKYGAEGIGLCRTEHMFFKEECLSIMQSMILAANKEERKKSLAQLLKFQREDFTGIFTAMNGLPVTIRLLDPPLHEFLPHSQTQDIELSKKININPEQIKERTQILREENPMLGHRGCRLGITFPEITEMQTRAIIEAAIRVSKEGIQVIPEIMIPLVGNVKELMLQREVIEETADLIFAEQQTKVDFSIGCMIEVPRAALQAGKIAEFADFFSFGTNDLTQMTMAFSRDDAAVFLSKYIEKDIYAKNPFETIDTEGVGQLVKMAIKKGRETKADLKLGVCGEHGGDPISIDFFNAIGLDYVSCSPFRIAVARLATAQAVLKSTKIN